MDKMSVRRISSPESESISRSDQSDWSTTMAAVNKRTAFGQPPSFVMNDVRPLENIPVHEQCFDANVTVPQLRTCLEQRHPVLVLMRGVPGSGKSYLANSLKPNNRGVVYSTDDYFTLNNGEYAFDPSALEEAHRKNFVRVFDAIKAKETPIFVDNTNIRKMHMTPYVKAAVRSGYEVYFLEPETQWRRNANKCAKFNYHNISARKIERLLEEFENVTLRQCLPESTEIVIRSSAPAKKPPAAGVDVCKTDSPVVGSDSARPQSTMALPPPSTSPSLGTNAKSTPQSSQENSPVSRRSKKTGFGLTTVGNSWKENIPQFMREGLTDDQPPPRPPSRAMEGLSLAPVPQNTEVSVREFGCQVTESVLLMFLSEHDRAGNCDRHMCEVGNVGIAKRRQEAVEVKERPTNTDASNSSKLELLMELFPDPETKEVAAQMLATCEDNLPMAVGLLLDIGSKFDVDSQAAALFKQKTQERKVPQGPLLDVKFGLFQKENSPVNSQTGSEDDGGYITLELGPASCEQLQQIFGFATDEELPADFLAPGQRQARIPLTLASQLFSCWRNTVRDPTFDYGLIEFPQLSDSTFSAQSSSASLRNKTQIEKDGEYARRLWQDENNQKPKPPPEPGQSLASKMNLKKLQQSFPTIDAGAIARVFQDNHFHCEHTEAVLKAVCNQSNSTPQLPYVAAEKNENGYAEWENISYGPSTAADDNKSCQNLRNEVVRLAAKRDELFKQAQAAYQSGNHGAATHYSQEARKYRRQVVEENREVAQEIFRRRNEGKQINEIDLHYLHVEESIQCLRERLAKMDRPEELRSGPGRKLRVITGAGNNSAQGAKIRPAVLGWLKQHKYTFCMENPGIVAVDCK